MLRSLGLYFKIFETLSFSWQESWQDPRLFTNMGSFRWGRLTRLIVPWSSPIDFFSEFWIFVFDLMRFDATKGLKVLKRIWKSKLTDILIFSLIFFALFGCLSVLKFCPKFEQPFHFRRSPIGIWRREVFLERAGRFGKIVAYSSELTWGGSARKQNARTFLGASLRS